MRPICHNQHGVPCCETLSAQNHELCGLPQIKQSVAYALYAMTNTFLPNSVAAVVLFYGGHLVLDGHMSAGALVSFMLYEQSLAGAFQVTQPADVAGCKTAQRLPVIW